MALDATARGRKPELPAVAVASAQIKPALAQPIYSEILEHMAKRKYPQRLPVKFGPIIFIYMKVFVLQASLARIAQPAATEIITLHLLRVFFREGGVDMSVNMIGKCRDWLTVIEIKKISHQNGTSVSALGALVAIASS